MTRLLVSVRNAVEARAALEGGADIIDVKEPRHGSLGAADADVWTSVAAVVGDTKRLSVALGEVSDAERLLNDAKYRSALERYRFAKMGLAGLASPPSLDAQPLPQATWLPRWKQVADSLPDSIQRVAVVYADFAGCGAPGPLDILEGAGEVGCKHVLVDTYDKSAGSLLEHWGRDRLEEFVSAARTLGMRVVLAGSLRMAHLPTLLSVKPDLVAVRGAVCTGPRDGPLAESLVRQWATQLANRKALS